jgi:hypothetical protein
LLCVTGSRRIAGRVSTLESFLTQITLISQIDTDYSLRSGQIAERIWNDIAAIYRFG